MSKSFIDQLFKGFVRSAVNQVGRDGGRVISNEIYGNAHGIKVSSADQQLSVQGAPLQ